MLTIPSLFNKTAALKWRWKLKFQRKPPFLEKQTATLFVTLHSAAAVEFQPSRREALLETTDIWLNVTTQKYSEIFKNWPIGLNT